ncbi:unnamed protein product [Penicillium palitans]
MTTPAALTRPIPGDREDYIYVCFGCDIILQDTTRRLDRILYTGPERCIGCQYSVDGGFLINTQASERIEKHRDFVRKELYWEFSQKATNYRHHQELLDRGKFMKEAYESGRFIMREA